MIDLAAPETIADPYPAYARLRDRAPLHLWELDGHPRGGIWLVSRYADVHALLADERVTKRGEPVGLDDPAPPILVFSDPPRHTRLRRPVTAAFTRRRMAALAGSVAADVQRRIAPILDGEAVDVVDAVALPLPLDTICRLLGVPVEDGPYLHDLTVRIFDGADSARSDTGLDDAVAADEEMGAYVREHVEQRRSAPRDDMLSALQHPDEGVGGLDVTETAAMFRQLVVAGHQTTTSLIGTGLWVLLNHRHAWDRLVADPSMIPTAVEECLRFESPTQRTGTRYALDDIELPCGTIPRGQQFAALLGSANRDERRFDRPDEVDVARSPNPHLAFGRGRHHCPGSALARLQAEEVLRQLLRRAPDLALTDRPVAWRPNSFDRGVTSLVVQRGG